MPQLYLIKWIQQNVAFRESSWASGCLPVGKPSKTLLVFVNSSKHREPSLPLSVFVFVFIFSFQSRLNATMVVHSCCQYHSYSCPFANCTARLSQLYGSTVNRRCLTAIKTRSALKVRPENLPLLSSLSFLH